MRRVQQLIEGIVQRCGLSRNAGHPLWRWRVRDDELASLKDALRHEMSDERLPDAVCGAFCLFAAHHFCRTYAGGPWAWEIMTEPIRWRPNLARLYRVVRRGLAFWSRRVMRFGDSHEYLVTLICEGGLPLRVVADHSNQGRVRRWFREVLRVAERFSMPAARAALELDELLPVMLRNELVRDTGAELIDRVICLRRDVANVDDPASRLDQLRPEWRQELPLELDEAVAREFINGLLKEPNSAPSVLAIPRIITHLNLEGMRLERAIDLPRLVQKETLVEWLGTTEIPVRLSFFLTTNDGARRQVAIATQQAQGEFWLVERGSTHAVIDAWPTVTSAVRVAVMSGVKDLGNVSPAGGDSLSEELPWVFEGRVDGRAKLLGVGSVRTAAASVLVAVPNAGALEPQSGSDLQPIGTLSASGRHVVRLQGEVRWKMDDAHCVIRTNGGDTEENSYMIAGPMTTVGFGGREVYRDHPPVMLFERGIRKAVATSSLRWRPARHGSWRRWNEPGFGDIKIRVVDDAEVHFETGLTVFPKDFEIRSIVERVDGAFQVRSSMVERAVVTLPDGTPLSTARRDGVWLICDGIDVKPDQVPRVHLHLWFRDGGETSLPLAPPRPFIGFVRFDGSPAGDRVSLDDLPVLRARVLTPETNATFDLEARRREFAPIKVASIQSRGDGFYELALDIVRPTLEALHIGDGLDDALELRIAKLGLVSPGQQQGMQVVSRKDAFTRVNNEDGTVDLKLHASVLATPNAFDPATLRVEARPIEKYFEHNPKGPVFELLRDGDGKWRFNSGNEPFEHWLVTAWQGGYCRLRPILITERKELGPSDSPLITAMRTSPQKKREELLVQVMRACAENGAHEDWDKLKYIMRTTASLPPATFDVVRLLPHVPEVAIAVLALLRKSDERLVAWSALETLDLLWETVPMVAWVRAARCLLDRIRHQPLILEVADCSAAEYVAKLLNALLDDVQKNYRLADIVRELLSKMLPLPPGEPKIMLAGKPGGRALFLRCIEEDCNEFRLRHMDDDEWPTLDIARFAQSNMDLERAFKEVRLEFNFPQHTRGVLDAPTLAAAMAATGVSLPLAARFELRRFRAFDQTWFQQCHAFQLALLLSSRIHSFVR